MDSAQPGRLRAESLAERLTKQFYAWETRGRGWDLWPAPVEPEPHFVPFFGHYDPNPLTPIDDGRRPRSWSGISQVLSWLAGKPAIPDQPTDSETVDPEPDLEPIWLCGSENLTEISVALPAETRIAADAMEQFFLGLGRLARPAAFEIVGARDVIGTQFVCGASDAVRLRGHVKALFPEATLTKPAASVKELWSRSGAEAAVVLEFGLSSECVRPLRRFGRLDPDPLAGLIGAMSSLSEDELAIFQILFMPTVNPWAESMLRAVTDGRGGSFFEDDPSMLSLAGQKVSAPLFAVVVRLAARAADDTRLLQILEALAASLGQFAEPRGNELRPLSNKGYEPLEHERDLLLRQSCRSGMLLNSHELISLAHLPSASVREPKLLRSVRKSKAAPVISRGHRMVLGFNDHAGESVPVGQSAMDRLKHTYVVGASGTGKSTLLLRMIVQDIENGEGLAVIDPHGDLIEHTLARIPEHRIDDVILIDPSDAEYPVGFNVLSAHSDLERNLLASDLVSVFQRLSTSWGDQMTVVLGNAILAFLESTEGGTLRELRRFLVEADFRKRFLETVADPEVVYYWQKEFPLLRGNAHAPILTRLNTFLRPKPIRAMVTAREKSLDLFSIMNERKILLVKLSQGLIGADNSYLLGALLVSKLNQAATSRQEIAERDRAPFYVYVDEFHHFVTPSMAEILSGARKYRLGLVLAHQDLQQISGRDSAVASAVISNPFTRICFRLGDYDAKKLADGFTYFDAKDLQNLGVGEAICRMERAEYTCNLRTEQLPPIDQADAEARRDQVVASSREQCAVRRVPKTRLPESEARALAPESAVEPTTAQRVQIRPAPTAAPERQSHKPPPVSSRTPGRGGQQHKYLQELVKRWAESRGFRATIEKEILGGLGSVDVAVERDGFSVACEISITTTAEHELGNVQKCLAAGFDRVVVLSTHKATLNRISKATNVLGEIERGQILFFQPEELFAYLESQQGPQAEEQQTVRGYKVRVTKNVVPKVEEEAKKRVIAGAILPSMRRLKDDRKP